MVEGGAESPEKRCRLDQKSDQSQFKAAQQKRQLRRSTMRVLLVVSPSSLTFDNNYDAAATGHLKRGSLDSFFSWSLSRGAIFIGNR